MGLPALAAMGLQAVGQIMGGQAAAAEGQASYDLSKYNAQLAERQAQAVEQRSTFEQGRQAEAAERQKGSLLASMGAAGVMPTGGTGLAVLQEQATESDLENRLIGYNYATQAQQARSQAQADLFQGRMAKQLGKNERLASFIGAGSTLLTGFSRAKDAYGSKKQAKV